eukprot:364890-Chlamydomonas_euryale.AAC.2
MLLFRSAWPLLCQLRVPFWWFKHERAPVLLRDARASGGLRAVRSSRFAPRRAKVLLRGASVRTAVPRDFARLCIIVWPAGARIRHRRLLRRAFMPPLPSCVSAAVVLTAALLRASERKRTNSRRRCGGRRPAAVQPSRPALSSWKLPSVSRRFPSLPVFPNSESPPSAFLSFPPLRPDR